MPGKSEDLENFSIGKAMEYYMKRSERRAKEKEDTKILGSNLVDFIFRDDRNDTLLDEIIEDFFTEAIQTLSAHPQGNLDLVQSVQSLIYNKMFRVEHPRLKKLLQLDFEAEFFGTLGKHSQIERAIENEIDIDTLKKTKIHSFILGLRNRFGGGGSHEDEEWTR